MFPLCRLILALRWAGSGSGVASFAGSAGGASGVDFLIPAPGGQVASADPSFPCGSLRFLALVILFFLNFLFLFG